MRMFSVALLATFLLAASFPPLARAAYGAKTWTFMVYLDADNNVEEYGIWDFNEMEVVGSTTYVNVVVQIDRIPDYHQTTPDWTGTRRYYVTQDTNPSVIGSDLIEDLGELNMGDPETLVSFMEWVIDNYPAERYCLVLWDHGYGYGGLCRDDTDEDHLTLNELYLALYTVKSEKGVFVDVVAFNACLMGMIEVVYEIRDCTPVVVASEEVMPAYGELGSATPYDTILEELISNPAMDGATLAQIWVQEYSYVQKWNKATVSAISTSNVRYLAQAVDDLALALIDALPQAYRQIRGCRRAAEEYGGYVGERLDFNSIDIYHFAYLVKENVADPDVKDKAVSVMANVDTTALAEWHGSRHSYSHGISVFFPQRPSQYGAYGYPETIFSLNLNWDEFLETYLGI